MINLIRNIKADNETLWIVIAIIVLVLAVLLAFLITGKIGGLGNKIITSFG